MKRFLTLLLVCVLALSWVLPAYAADGKVTYSGNAGKLIFAPGGKESLTDLFPNFKGVMPGDELTQKITVKNDANDKVKVKIYIRALGAHEESVAFLSQLGLKVAKSEKNKMAYMFDAAADQTAQLGDWVCLGTLYSGGEVNLDVTLQVPVELDNMFQDRVGYLDWEFRVEEFPVEPGDPEPPKTGDDAMTGLLIGTMVAALAGFIILLSVYKKKKKA